MRGVWPVRLQGGNLGTGDPSKHQGGRHLDLDTTCSTHWIASQPDQRLQALGKLAREGKLH